LTPNSFVDVTLEKKPNSTKKTAAARKLEMLKPIEAEPTRPDSGEQEENSEAENKEAEEEPPKMTRTDQFGFESAAKFTTSLSDIAVENATKSVTFEAELNRATSCKFHVKEPAARFTKRLSDQSVIEADNAVFECEISRPNADVKWFHKDVEVQAGDKYQIEVSNRRRTLIVTNCASDDEGDVKCVSEDDETIALLQIAVSPLQLSLFLILFQEKKKARSKKRKVPNSPVIEPAGKRKSRFSSTSSDYSEPLKVEPSLQIQESNNLSIQPNETAEEEIKKEEIEEEPPMPEFTVIDEPHYRCNKDFVRAEKSMRNMDCECRLPDDPAAVCCGDECINRATLVECSNRCKTGDRCTNRDFQRGNNAPVEVFWTKGKGHGLRATSKVKAGTFIMEYLGEVVSAKEFKKRSHEYARLGTKHHYFMELSQQATIDAYHEGSISRFINHSCEPNAETQKWTVNGIVRIGFFYDEGYSTKSRNNFRLSVYPLRKGSEVSLRCTFLSWSYRSRSRRGRVQTKGRR
jgi:hypothetical protein